MIWKIYWWPLQTKRLVFEMFGNKIWENSPKYGLSGNCFEWAWKKSGSLCPTPQEKVHHSFSLMMMSKYRADYFVAFFFWFGTGSCELLDLWRHFTRSIFCAKRRGFRILQKNRRRKSVVAIILWRACGPNEMWCYSWKRTVKNRQWTSAYNRIEKTYRYFT